MQSAFVVQASLLPASPPSPALVFGPLPPCGFVPPLPPFVVGPEPPAPPIASGFATQTCSSSEHTVFEKPFPSARQSAVLLHWFVFRSYRNEQPLMAKSSAVAVNAAGLNDQVKCDFMSYPAVRIFDPSMRGYPFRSAPAKIWYEVSCRTRGQRR